MKFRKIIIENFMALKHAEIALADRGLILVQGINKDDTSAVSNGAGKSSTFEALMWCLYGTTSRGDEGDAIINRFSDKGKNCRVQVTIEDGSETWLVTRHRKHKTGKNALHLHSVETTVTGESTVDHTQGTEKLTQELVNKVVGCPQDVFEASIYAGQGKMPELPGLTDKKLKLLVEEAAGTTILEAAYDEALGRARSLKADRDLLQVKVDRLADAIGDADLRILDLERRRDDWVTARDAQVRTIRDRAKTFADEAKTLEAEIAKVDEAALKGEIADCDAKIAGVKAEVMQERIYAGQVADAESDVKVRQSRVESLSNDARRAKKALEEVEHKIGCPCTECARPMTAAELAPAKKAATERLTKLVADLRAAKLDLEAREKALASLRETLDAHRASMSDVSAVSASRTAADARLRTLIELQRQRQRAIELAKREIDQAKAKIAEANPFNDQIDTTKAQRDKLRGDLEAQEKRLEEMNVEVEIAESVTKVFSPAGVRAHILDTVTPFLNEQTAKYLSTLSDGNMTATWSTLSRTAKGELREKFVIEVENTLGGEAFSSISGGEQRKVCVAAALALQDLVASRATKPIELFIGDEIDNALDPAGIERLMNILEEKARERGSVFVISHSDLKDWCPQVLVVTKDGKLSTISEVYA